MSERKDLTRWNRAGLGAFRYVDGNAVTFLEEVRLGMIARFNKASSGPWRQLGAIPSPTETERARYDRLLEQYRGPRKEYAWEILRTFSRSIHVLTEHLDAYANEGFLKTATQWDHVRRLVELLDYHPAPPASASTYLAIFGKIGLPGTVTKGFKVKNEPKDGTKPLVFETLDDLEVDPVANTLRPTSWNRSSAPFVYSQVGNVYRAVFPLESPVEGLSAGAVGILLIDLAGGTVGIPVVMDQVSDTEISLAGPEPSQSVAGAQLGHVRLQVLPEIVQAPRLTGNQTLAVDRDISLVVGDHLAWYAGGRWRAGRVVAVERRRIRMETGGQALPDIGTALHRLAESVRAQGRIVIPIERGGSGTVWGTDFSELGTTRITSGGTAIRDEVTSSAPSKAFYLFQSGGSIGLVEQRSLASIEFAGSPGNIESGSWVVLDSRSHSNPGDAVEGLVGARVTRIVEQEDQFSVQFDGLATVPTHSVLQGGFSRELRPLGHHENRASVEWIERRSESQSVLLVEGNTLPACLVRGRRLVVRDESGAESVVLREATLSAAGLELVVEPALKRPFVRYNTEVLGNVVIAGHGESKPEKVLGSGDATQAGQEMSLDVEGVSFVTDSSMPSGVRADVEIMIGLQTWRQVARLDESGPEDADYTVEITESGTLVFRFGDGSHGRRLPTGRNNVRVRYRVGTGLAGNLAAGSLSKPVQPSPWVGSVAQPVDASGGNDWEDVASMRSNAPKSVLALERAVSLSDYSVLAARHSGVWQAKAFRLPTGYGYHENVQVAVVPAGGGELALLGDELGAFLVAHSVPGVRVEVVRFREVYIDLAITLRVRSAAFDPEVVTGAVDVALRAAFGLETRRLGAPLCYSEIYAVVEAVEGVENSDCRFSFRTADGTNDVSAVAGADGNVRRVRIREDQVIFLHAEESTVDIVTMEFSP